MNRFIEEGKLEVIHKEEGICVVVKEEEKLEEKRKNSISNLQKLYNAINDEKNNEGNNKSKLVEDLEQRKIDRER